MENATQAPPAPGSSIPALLFTVLGAVTKVLSVIGALAASVHYYSLIGPTIGLHNITVAVAFATTLLTGMLLKKHNPPWLRIAALCCAISLAMLYVPFEPAARALELGSIHQLANVQSWIITTFAEPMRNADVLATSGPTINTIVIVGKGVGMVYPFVAGLLLVANTRKS